MVNVDTVEKIIKEAETIAVVGLSSNPDRDSHRVSKYLQEQGYRIVPVNPNVQAVLGERCYPALSEIPIPVDTVNIFRRPEYVPELVEEAVKIGAKSIWMQIGISHPEAAHKAQEASLAVVMDRCMMVEHRRLVYEGRLT